MLFRSNPVAEKLTGWRVEEARGRPLQTVFSIINSLTLQPIESPVKKVVDSGEILHVSNHTTLISKDGKELHISDSAAPIVSNGKITGVILVFNDMTEDYYIREKLKSNEQEQRDILEYLIDAVVTVDDLGTILTFNKSAENLFGYRPNEIIGNHVEILFSETTFHNFNYYMKQYFDTADSRMVNLDDDQAVTVKRKNGEVFPIRLMVNELPKDNNGHRRFIGSCYDLSTEIKREEQLRRSQKMDALGKLTGGVAHDFNNSLSVILGYSELLKKELADQPKLSKYIDHIANAGQRGAKLTNKLLSFSRDTSPEAKILDINTLLLAEQDMLQKTLTVAVELSLDLEDDLWPVFIDISDLENAILNMSINAMHAMAKNDHPSTLAIKTRNQSLNVIEAQSVGLQPGDYVLLGLADNGLGMSEEVKEKIFDPFFSTKGEQGTGLGLFQIYGLVSRSKGVITVHSEPGKGSNFSLYFPRYTQGKDLKPFSDKIKKLPFSNGETVLVVDDETALRELTVELLEGQGYNVLSAENGKQALQILETEPIDLMLSDIIMPVMGGAKLANIVREKYPKIKIQLASGFSDEESGEEINELLQKNLLHKPYSAEVLFNKLSTLLKN